MAPRGRGRPKKGLTRMDAALDAMRAFGFPHKLIRKTIKELLSVYGEDGWPFIEESCYKVLLDSILEKVEKEEEDEKTLIVSQAAAHEGENVVCETGDRSSSQKVIGLEIVAANETSDGNLDGDKDLRNNDILYYPPQLLNSPSLPKRSRPYYGWIDSDDEDDLVELGPTILPPNLVSLLVGTDRSEGEKLKSI